MKNYMMITQESLLKISQCFSNGEEIETFMTHFMDLTEETYFNMLLAKRTDDDTATNLFMKQLCLLAIFCREHIELIHEMINALDCRPMSHEEIDKLGE